MTKTTIKTKKVAVVPGDGIGKEVIPAALDVVRAAMGKAGEPSLQFTEFDWSADRYLKDGTTIPDGDAGFAMLARDFDAMRQSYRQATAGQHPRQGNSVGHALQDGFIRECASGEAAG